MDGSREVSPRDFLVSDAEREHVVGLLQRATGQGRITLEQFTERIDRALAARTRQELNSVLVDIPGMVLNEPAARGEIALDHQLSSLARKGRWVVPRTVVLRGTLGNSHLDFTEAVITEPVVNVELRNALGNATLILPEGSTVNTDGLIVVAGKLDDRVGPGRQVGTPHFVLTGSVHAGSVTIQLPKGSRRRR